MPSSILGVMNRCYTADHALSVPTRIEDFCLYGADPGFGSMPASSSSAIINTDLRCVQVVDAKLNIDLYYFIILESNVLKNINGCRKLRIGLDGYFPNFIKKS